MTSEIKEQILAVRDTSLANMFDVHAVQRIAYELDFYELVTWLDENTKEYVDFILYGDENITEMNNYHTSKGGNPCGAKEQ